MNINKVTNISNRIGKLALGTVQFGIDYGINNIHGKISRSEAEGIVDYAYKNGVSVLDTARSYGHAEATIGEILLLDPSYRYIEVVTKISYDPALSLRQNIAVSCKNLKRNFIDTVLFHSFEDYKLYSDSIDVKEIFNIRKLGISVYTNAEIERILDDSRIKVIQVPFNLLDNEYQRAEILRLAKSKGKEVHTRSAFLQGLFFKKPDDITSNLIGLRKELESIQDLCKDYNVSVSDLALQYCLSKDYIDKVIIGIDTLDHLQININSCNTVIPQELVIEIDKISVKAVELLYPTNWQ